MLASAVLSTALVAGFEAGVARAACNWEPARAAIDRIVREGSESGREFRKQVQEGWDPYATILKLANPLDGEKIDDCRFESLEYLVKIGFPSSH